MQNNLDIKSTIILHYDLGLEYSPSQENQEIRRQGLLNNAL